MRHIASISGGKDSTALWLLAMERGVDIHPVFADTGHEHPQTYEYLEYLERTLGPIQRVQADLSHLFAAKRRTVETKWRAEGVDEWRVLRALELLKPTGNPFLDLCVLKGRFPSTRARFCSQELKHKPIRELVVDPLLADGETVVSWHGVRWDESRSRAGLPIVDEPEEGLIVYRPLVAWSAQDVFDMHKRHGVAWNPLYEQGMGRVGCMPCIHARKGELAEIARRWPDVIDRIEAWEAVASAASKRGATTFFAVDKIPGDHTSNHALPMPGIREISKWSGTDRGGVQYPLQLEDDIPLEMCSSIYGLCEAAG